MVFLYDGEAVSLSGEIKNFQLSINASAKSTVTAIAKFREIFGISAPADVVANVSKLNRCCNYNMSRAVKFTFTVVVFCVAFNAKPSAALEAIKVFRGTMILEGKIEPGDYISVRNFLRLESNFKKISGGVFLASPGGYVVEAMKIGNLI